MSVKKPTIKGKKPHKNKTTSKKHTKYKIDGDKIVRERSCPRCGPGVFLATGQGRFYCGKCHFTEFAKKVVGGGGKEKVIMPTTQKNDG